MCTVIGNEQAVALQISTGVAGMDAQGFGNIAGAFGKRGIRFCFMRARKHMFHTCYRLQRTHQNGMGNICNVCYNIEHMMYAVT